ncbi:hypothetical protein BFJ63_vAg16120 [Fusarium oxysporum f. sp. narcissi]|uniref:Uncharacterized protein n=1 Tax=Fusarium oxysporum f. sp. narcissi TaxID=451672 RepID=A0A4Q2V9X8_FUSOX|nr:hypothetical protein BFJ63_vAg16120 [Fusarium oxysporum f. sp. narcissi]
MNSGSIADPIRDLVFRRSRYDTNCRHIAEQRDDRYRQFSIDVLIALAFYTVSTQLEAFQDLNSVAQIALQKYHSENSDFFSDWQKYCKALNGRLRAVATFEAIKAAHPQPRHAASPSNPTLPQSMQRVAVMADVDKAKGYLRGYLFMGTKLSHMRKQEECRQSARLTDTVRLHLPAQADEDCMLEVRVCRSIGDAISEARATSMGDLTEMLGDYLFGAMGSSHWREEEKSNGMLESTNAVRVLPCEDGSEDQKLEIILCFETGKELYTSVFP